LQESTLARTKTTRYSTEGEEVRRWRDGLDDALRAPKRRRRPWRIVAGGLVLLVIVGTLAGFSYWRVIGGLFNRTNVTLTPGGNGALNFLLVGSDSREGLNTPEDVARFGSVGGKRTDTIILAQIVPRQQRGVMLSIPRDLWVTVHGGGRLFQGKINSAYQYGPQSVVDTVSALTGVPINHYMEIDIRGFRNMVDAIGGIDVALDKPLYDSKLNFRLPAGMDHMDGNTALSFVRSRHTAAGDFDRIKRQQAFIRAVMSKVGKPSVLGNPIRVNNLARAFARNVTVDQYFQLSDLIRFALGVRKVGQNQLQTLSVPGRSARVGGQSVVLMDTQQAAPLFAALRDVTAPPGTPVPQAAGTLPTA
jgi:LCP family protein required for cell wall assembly